MSLVLDEEAQVHRFTGLDRRRLGAFFTPAPLVERTLDLALKHCDTSPLSIIDPACGAGAFLAAAAQRRPEARLFGAEISPDVAKACQERLPQADIHSADALRGGLSPLLSRLPAGHDELWIGNPPYNGRSSLLDDPKAYAELRKLGPARMPKGTSLRDDFAFFLLLAAERLKHHPGVLAFITPASLLDAFLYAPLREQLLKHLTLREVVNLGPGHFANTRVHTCITVWSSRALPLKQAAFTPQAPEWSLAPASAQAQALHQKWSAQGEPLDQLIPVSFPGLKTRFDALLVDEDPERLLSRLQAFAGARASQLKAFAAKHGLPEVLLPKLKALHAAGPFHITREKLRPFFRYAGARHRGRLPPEAKAWCYLDRTLIPRGDHRLRGAYDPHVGEVKLLFNVRERPLSAALLEETGCVHDHRHARFAPLFVPARVREKGLSVTGAGASLESLGPWVPNLSARGLAWAETLGGPLAAFRWLTDFLNGPEVQEVWAPAYATSRVVSVPL